MATLTVPEPDTQTASLRVNRTQLVPLAAVVTLVLSTVFATGILPSTAAVQVACIAVAAALLATFIGAAVLRVTSARSIGAQAGVLALTAVLGVALGTIGASNAMFLSNHDERILLVVLSSGAVTALAGAAVLGRNIDRCTKELIGAARRIGGSSDVVTDGRHPGEFARLAGELQETSQRLRDQQSQTQALEQSRKDLIVWVSGDLRKVIADVEQLSDADTEQSQQLRDEVARMRRLVDDLSDLYGAETAGRTPVV